MEKPTSTPIVFLILLLLGGVGVFLYKVGAGVALPELPVEEFSGETMGTTYQVQLAGQEKSFAELVALKELVDAELIAVNDAMSTYIPESEISRFNRLREAGVPFEISPRFREVIFQSLEFFFSSNGAFDPTLGPLIDLWGFGAGPASTSPPSEEQIQALRTRIGLNRITLSEEGLSKSDPDLEINLSAIAKGYAVDRVMDLMLAQGYENIYVEIGGEVACVGVNGLSIPWRIGIQMPDPEAGATALKVVRLENQAMATSGDYRNFIGSGDETLHHILDPRTGRPANHTLASVSVLAKDCMTADAVATILYVMGTEEGMNWLANRQDVEAYFIDRDGADFRFTHTPGFKDAIIALP